MKLILSLSLSSAIGRSPFPWNLWFLSQPAPASTATSKISYPLRNEGLVAGGEAGPGFEQGWRCHRTQGCWNQAKARQGQGHWFSPSGNAISTLNFHFLLSPSLAFLPQNRTFVSLSLSQNRFLYFVLRIFENEKNRNYKNKAFDKIKAAS